MLDYKHIEALAKVIQEGGFERAARVLFLTQSAVSQRIRQLEETSGQILISRTSPPQPTAAGKALLKHYQQVKLLEEGLSSELVTSSTPRMTTLKIGINADSLAHWFITAIAPMLQKAAVLIDLRVDDQEQTHHYLRAGEVVGCISTEANAMQGCRVEALGTMTYRLLAAPDFIRQWFPKGLSTAGAEHAPSIFFNRNDRLHHHFLEKYIGSTPNQIPAHFVPAPAQFLQMITAGYSYGVVPDWQSRDLLQSGKLLEIIPDATLQVELYWHCWNLATRPLQEFSAQLIAGAKKHFTNQ